MSDVQPNLAVSHEITDGCDEGGWLCSRAKWVEPALIPRSGPCGSAVLYMYPTPSNRWNGAVYSGHIHVGDVIGGKSIAELKLAVSSRDYVLSDIKEFTDSSGMREELMRLGLICNCE